MAKGFGKGFVTGVAGKVAAVAGAVYTFKKKVIEPEEQKQLSSKKTAKKQHVAVSHTNHSKSSGKPELFVSVSCFYILISQSKYPMN